MTINAEQTIKIEADIDLTQVYTTQFASIKQGSEEQALKRVAVLLESFSGSKVEIIWIAMIRNKEATTIIPFAGVLGLIFNFFSTSARISAGVRDNADLISPVNYCVSVCLLSSSFEYAVEWFWVLAGPSFVAAAGAQVISVGRGLGTDIISWALSNRMTYGSLGNSERDHSHRLLSDSHVDVHRMTNSQQANNISCVARYNKKQSYVHQTAISFG